MRYTTRGQGGRWNAWWLSVFGHSSAPHAAPDKLLLLLLTSLAALRAHLLELPVHTGQVTNIMAEQGVCVCGGGVREEVDRQYPVGCSVINSIMI